MNLIRFIYRKLRKGYASIAIRSKAVSIIANNCIGADILHDLGLRFNTPTINMQILPEDFSRFVSKLPYYMSTDVVECTSFTAEDDKKIRRTYKCGGGNLTFPIGKCDDVLLFFQHYNSFDEAKVAWVRRSKRINYDRLAFLLVVGEAHLREAVEFDNVVDGKGVIFCVNFDPVCAFKCEVRKIKCPPGVHFMEYETLFKKYYEQEFNSISFLMQL